MARGEHSTPPDSGARRHAYYLRWVIWHGGGWLWRRFSVLAAVISVTVVSLVTWLATIDPLLGVAVGLLACLAMFVAGSYKMWSEQEARSRELRERADDVAKRLALKSLLGELQELGAARLVPGLGTSSQTVDAWEAQVFDLVRQAMGRGEVSRMLLGEMRRSAPIAGMKSDDAAIMRTRVAQIGELIPRVESML